MTTPDFPSEGYIESYDPGDALGWINLDGGGRVRFGRSACSFDPAAHDRVRVLDARSSPAGHLKATMVELIGDRDLTLSDRLPSTRGLLLMPVDTYSSWALACHLRSTQAEHVASHQAIREELYARGVSQAAIEEMASLARWAADVLSPRNGMVQHVIGDRDDVAWAIETAAERGIISNEEAERMRECISALGS